jgi:hypothetical protein
MPASRRSISLANVSAYTLGKRGLKLVPVDSGLHLTHSQARILHYLWLQEMPVGFTKLEHKYGLGTRQIREAIPGLLELDFIERVDRRYAITIFGRAYLQQLDRAISRLIRQHKAA